MTDKGFKLTRFADDWLIVCKSRTEAEMALKTAKEELERLGLTLHPDKTRITNIIYTLSQRTIHKKIHGYNPAEKQEKDTYDIERVG